MFTALALVIFVVGYIGITLEHNLKLNKSALALAIGGALWMLVPFAHVPHPAGHGYEEIIFHSAAEIFEIVVFLLSAMSLVEILVHYQFFDVVRGKIYQLGLDDKKQFLVICGLTFFLSAIIDNLTATIVMIQIARKFFKGDNLVKTAAAIVIAANAGGAYSPLGDVTTIMMWLAGKFGTFEIILRGFLPSLTMGGIATAMIYPQIEKGSFDVKREIVTKLSRSETIIVAMTFGSFLLPLVMSFIGLPPYIGLLTGLGVVWFVVDVFKQVSKRETHLEVKIDQLLQKTDISSLKFFIGILLAVSALNSLGILDTLSHVVFGEDPSFNRIVLGNTALGLISSVLDNVPLTAIAIDALHTNITGLWILLAITVGTGGSFLVIGSAAGVIAMGMVKELNFGRYLKIAGFPVLVAYFAAVAVWFAQYQAMIALGIVPTPV